MRVLFLFLILFIPLVSALDLEECTRHTLLTTDVPCKVISTYKPAAGCAANVSIFSQNGSLIQVQEWEDSTPFCEFSWNISEPIGTYIFNSSIEDGVTTLAREDNMLSIILVQIFLVMFFIFLGLPHKVGFLKMFAFGLATLELLTTIWIIYLVEAGRSILNFLWINSIVALLIGVPFGIYSLIVFQAKLMKIDEDKVVKDDAYTKYVFGK